MLYTSIQFSVILFLLEYRAREVPEKLDLCLLGSQTAKMDSAAEGEKGKSDMKLIKFVWFNNSAGSILIGKR